MGRTGRAVTIYIPDEYAKAWGFRRGLVIRLAFSCLGGVACNLNYPQFQGVLPINQRVDTAKVRHWGCKLVFGLVLGRGGGAQPNCE